MKKFFKENFVLVVGVSLPLVLIALFFLAGQVSRQAVEDPQYDAVFAVDYHDNVSGNPYRISVDNGDIVVKFRPSTDEDRHYAKPRLFVFDHKTRQSRLIDIDYESANEGIVTDPDLAALNTHKIDPNPASPDGYKFEYNYHSSGGLFGEIFGSYRDRSYYALRNGPRAVPVEGPEPFYQAHFIGWVITP